MEQSKEILEPDINTEKLRIKFILYIPISSDVTIAHAHVFHNVSALAFVRQENISLNILSFSAIKSKMNIWYVEKNQWNYIQTQLLVFSKSFFPKVHYVILWMHKFIAAMTSVTTVLSPNTTTYLLAIGQSMQSGTLIG